MEFDRKAEMKHLAPTLAFAAFAATLSPAIAHHPAPADSSSADREPALVRNQDGSFTITAAVQGSAPSLSPTTGGLVVGGWEKDAISAAEERDRHGRGAEAKVDRAFEEAVDEARDARPR